MAPSRGRRRVNVHQAPHGATPTRRTRRPANRVDGEPKDVYQDMLAEAAVVDPTDDESTRPLKRPRVASNISAPSKETRANFSRKRVASSPASQSREVRVENEVAAYEDIGALQTIEDSSKSDDDDESDFAFEDVDLEHPAASSPAKADDESDDGIKDISVAVDPSVTSKARAQSRRQPISNAEKARRLVVHKLHILCLLGHCMFVNSWCNNAIVQRHLRPLLSKKTLSYLNPKTDDSQFQRNRSFIDGLQQASDAFHVQFQVTGCGMTRVKWSTEDEASSTQTDTEPIDRAEFIISARDRRGSQDTGNQLFCALLRSVGVDARLVCSLQSLPVTNFPAKHNTPQKTTKPTVFATALLSDAATTPKSSGDSGVKISSPAGKAPTMRRRLGQPGFAPERVSNSSPKRKKPIRTLSYPVFWIEAFNKAHQKWIPVDPIVTQTVSKPSKLEPPLSYEFNQMSYAIAFEDDGVARDVTRRYTRAYNAKTRRNRVESTDQGTQWFKKAMRIFRRRRGPLDRELIEDADLAQREAGEGLPSNVQDFKDHPYYALERHLKRHEVIHLRREVGKVNAGTAAKPRMETVFRRADVLVCWSADKWYRFGREVQHGEQPVKYVPARSRRSTRIDNDGDTEESNQIGLYAPFQTETYVPPPVERGRIPKNAYGNLDIYVPSMVPAGGTHVRHKLAKQAARVLQIDYADAVTGFQFKGRQGTAIIEGAVVASSYAEAVWAVIDGFQDEQQEEEAMARSAVALRMWRRFLIGLRIMERISGYGETSSADRIQQQLNEEGIAQEESVEAGGFFPGAEDEGDALPTAGRFSLAQLSEPPKASKKSRRQAVQEESEEEDDHSEHDTFADDEADYKPTNQSNRKRRTVIVDEESEDDYLPDVPTFHSETLADENPIVENEQADSEQDEGGGFLPEDAADVVSEGGGFLADGMGPTETLEGSGGGFLLEESAGDVPADGSVATMDGGLVPDVGDQSQSATSTDHGDSSQQANNSGSGCDPDNVGSVNSRNAPPQHPQPAPDISDVPSGTAAPETYDEADEDAEMDDRGSMISHDPEDEDAEPDWLESD